MKKHSIIAFCVILIGHNLYSLSEKETMALLQNSFTIYEKNVASPDGEKQWAQAFNYAKAFVIDQSKNFFGKQDQNIVDAINILEKANQAFVALVVPGTRPSSVSSGQLSDIPSIQRSITEAMNKVSQSSRKEAKNMITTLALCLTRFTQAAIKVVPPTRPTSATPERPLFVITSTMQNKMNFIVTNNNERSILVNLGGRNKPALTAICERILGEFKNIFAQELRLFPDQNIGSAILVSLKTALSKYAGGFEQKEILDEAAEEAVANVFPYTGK